MNLRIIHSEWVLNLVETSFTMVEENNWFSDKVFSKYTYPISRTLSDAEDVAFNYISEYASQGVATVFGVIFEVLDEQYTAVMEIEKIVGRRIEFQVRYGFEEFPNFEKKLAQLPLHKFDLVGETIYEHAQTKITQTTADYNFPAIFTDKFDTESPQWQAFEGRINNYTGTVFLQNEYDAVNDIQLNRNVMQPLPSLLYVLKQGFADKGYVLGGDILDDPEFKKAFIYSLSEYYSTITDNGKQEMVINCDEFIGPDPDPDRNGYYFFQDSIIIASPGRYKIAGNLFLPNHLIIIPPKSAMAVLTIDGQAIGGWFGTEKEKFVFLDIIFEVLPGQSNLPLQFTASCSNYREVGGTLVYDAPLLDLTVSQLTAYNPDGSAQPTLVLPNEIDLTRCVPDITFGDLYKAVKAWKNYGVHIEGNNVVMNKIKQQFGKAPFMDLSHKEASEPERSYNQGRTFELKFAEVGSEDYEYASIYVDYTGSSLSPYVPKENTEEIIIDAIPLPLKTESSVRTAHGFLDDKQKIQVVLYDGLYSGKNLCRENDALLIPEIYTTIYKEWIDFLLNTVSFLWTFNDYDVNVRELKVRTTIYAYGVYHVILRFTKKNVAQGIIQTEIETYSIK